MDIKDWIRDVPDFPKAGILFKDIAPLLNSPSAFAQVVDDIAKNVQELKPQKIAAIEARGFFFASPVALKLGVGLVPLRKPGKLPGRVYSETYELEYAQNRLEMQQDAVCAGERVVVIDDVLATGGTALAAWQLLQKAGADVVGFMFLLELNALQGRSRLSPKAPVLRLLSYS